MQYDDEAKHAKMHKTWFVALASFRFDRLRKSEGLISYSTDVRDEYYRGADSIDRVLKGAKPSDLPFEVSANIRLVVNLRTADALRLTIPQSILLRADEVIR